MRSLLCKGEDVEELDVQAVCVEAGELYYTNVAPDQQFMAVYAGRTPAEARSVLAKVRAAGKYPGANLRRMRAGINGT